MGGPGSGRKRSKDRKLVVENSLTIDLRTLIEQGLLERDHSQGSISWSSGGSVIYHLEIHTTDSYLLNLEYRRHLNGTQHELDYSILIEPLTNRYAKYGHIFNCPLTTGGVKCSHHSSKLYLPSGSLYFGCRHCHNLTYRFCQEYHRHDYDALKLEVEKQRFNMTGYIC